MFNHTKALQFEAKPDKPDALYARKLQEALGGAFGEMTVAMQYLLQGWNCRVPGKYKDMLMDIGTQELAHVEMFSIMIARLLEGAPAEDTAAAAAANPALAAVLGGQNPQHAIVTGGGPALADSNGNPWQGSYVVASGNLLADFYTDVGYEMQGRMQATRLYQMTDDQGVKNMLRFNIARDVMHQNQWLAAIEELGADGIEALPVPNRPQVEQDDQYAYQYMKYSDGQDALGGRWSSGSSPDGLGTFTSVDHPAPLGAPPLEPLPSDPKLFDTLAVESTPAAVGKDGLLNKVKDAVS